MGTIRIDQEPVGSEFAPSRQCRKQWADDASGALPLPVGRNIRVANRMRMWFSSAADRTTTGNRRFKGEIMKNPRWLLAVALLLLSACTPFRMSMFDPGGNQGFDPGQISKPDREFPNVWIIDNAIVVDQEPIRVPRGVNRVRILWALERSSEYSFPENAITIAATPGSAPLENVNCGAFGAQRRGYLCTFDRAPGRAVYKYSIRVNRGGTSLESLDPQIMTD